MTKTVDIGDVLETPYGTMKVVDIEVSYIDENGAYIETRLVDE